MIPEWPSEQRTDPTFLMPRYEDVTQDGRIVLPSIMPGLGVTVWKSMLESLAVADTFRAQGILPILSRLVVRAEAQGPFTVHAPIRFDGTWQFAREEGGSRLFLNMWMEARAPIGSTFARPPRKDAETVVVGRVFAEHVITRPFAPPAERRVTTLDGPGLPKVSELPLHAFHTADALAKTAPVERAADFVFGMMHTDSNQHVNSLAYPRIFEETLVRHLAGPGRAAVPDGVSPSALLAREIELRWRKPFFTGEHAVISLAMLPAPAGSPGKVEAIGTFSPKDGEEGARPSCALRMAMG